MKRGLKLERLPFCEVAGGGGLRARGGGFTDTSRGHLSVGVPGTVRGLALAHEKFGRLPWKELVEPAVRLAAEGFPVEPSLARSVNSVLGRAGEYHEFGRGFGKPDGSWWSPLPAGLIIHPDRCRLSEP